LVFDVLREFNCAEELNNGILVCVWLWWFLKPKRRMDRRVGLLFINSDKGTLISSKI
jgi:hypothetical protein